MDRAEDDPPAIDRKWLGAWCAAMVVCALMAAGYERLLRGHGYDITVQDDADLWSMQYDKLKAPNAVALLGASRTQFGVDPVLLSREIGRPVAMLAVNGTVPLAPLRALAQDEHFAGIVVVGIDARTLQRKHWEMQQSYIDHYAKRWTLARRIHRTILTEIQERLILVRSPFSLVNILDRFLDHQDMPLKDHTVVRADRVGFIDAHHPDLAWTHNKRIVDLKGYYVDNVAPAASDWLADLSVVSGWIDRIERRGGRVVFFREPESGESLEMDEANFPRDRFWDAYARVSPATMIDFRDIPAFSTFTLPDTSHIDGSDVPRYTAAFADMLKSRGVVAP